MEKYDLMLIEKLIPKDQELRKYYEEHLHFKELIHQLDQKPYLTPREEMRRKELKKRKLAGKDKIEAILSQYRRNAQRTY
ncbi:MAG: DUF465 domain-containing protein [Deltaproteobacteria bacterium]|nr:MAG: DUF465 domain-containing protein [Deltaproteobacteria bacterium]